ncbi:unnamed protein product [Lactuca saligna]|uniref:Uncharacterized protein n=1 Tax=Lactuca saligna TaxID=75948 RepID=A0AA35ZLC6_LACSI|nr:unnamed protein product [Lactuca saligna]
MRIHTTSIDSSKSGSTMVQSHSSFFGPISKIRTQNSCHDGKIKSYGHLGSHQKERGNPVTYIFSAAGGIPPLVYKMILGVPHITQQLQHLMLKNKQPTAVAINPQKRIKKNNNNKHPSHIPMDMKYWKLETGSDKAWEDAPYVLWKLCCHSEDIYACVESAEAIPVFLWFLKTGGTKGQEASGKALRKLIRMADAATIN